MKRICIAVVFLLLSNQIVTARAADGELTPLDVMKLRVVSAVYPSPDGQLIAFTRGVPRLADDAPGSNYSNLYLVPTRGGPERTMIGRKTSVRGVSWKPDGSQLCFLDKREGDEYTQVYALSMSGGEPVRLTQVSASVSQYRWRPDGRAIAYTARDEAQAATKERQAMGFQQTFMDEYWLNSSLYLLDLATGTSKRLTSGMHVNSFRWSPDGRTLAAALSPRSLIDDNYMFQRLHLVHTEGPTVEKLVDNPGKLGDYTFSPDGKRLAYISAADRRDPHAGMLYTVDLDSRLVTSLTDGFEGMVHEIRWLEADSIMACISRGVHTHIARLELASRRWRDQSPLGPAFESFAPVKRRTRRSTSVDDDGAVEWVVVGSTAKHPAEVFRFGESWHRLTESNSWLKDRTLGKQTVETITARDGLRIEGLLHYPVNYEPSKRYPLVILAHGGPESHFVNGWNTSYGRWGQLLSARGYFAWYPNYRASTGRGVEFAKADHGDPMGAEFTDHLDAIAEFDRRGLIDRKRVGIGGGSYGGYTAAWAATRHSEHFAAAVAFVPVVDLRTKWFCSDIPMEYFLVHYEEMWPHEQPGLMAERSPLTYAEHCRTPLLLLGGTDDTRVHPSQPFMLYRAVKFATKTPVRYVRYPGEGHGNRVNVNRYDYCVRTLRWFDHYLKPGDHRNDALPTRELDYSAWQSTKGSE